MKKTLDIFNNILLVIIFIFVLHGCSETNLLFYGETVLLTPEPISLSYNWVTIEPQETLDIVEDVPILYVDITKFVGKNLNDPQYEKFISELRGKVEGEIISINGNTVKFEKSDIVGHPEAGYVEIHIGASKVLTKYDKQQKYKTVRLRSKVVLPSVYVYWSNTSK